MIDIGQKITIYFLQNVLKCTVFCAIVFKVYKKCNYEPNYFFLKKISMGVKKNCSPDFKVVDADLKNEQYNKISMKISVIFTHIEALMLIHGDLEGLASI
jgi:hypothetical protein